MFRKTYTLRYDTQVDREWFSVEYRYPLRELRAHVALLGLAMREQYGKDAQTVRNVEIKDRWGMDAIHTVHEARLISAEQKKIREGAPHAAA